MMDKGQPRLHIPLLLPRNPHHTHLLHIPPHRLLYVIDLLLVGVSQMLQFLVDSLRGSGYCSHIRARARARCRGRMGQWGLALVPRADSLLFRGQGNIHLVNDDTSAMGG